MTSLFRDGAYLLSGSIEELCFNLIVYWIMCKPFQNNVDYFPGYTGELYSIQSLKRKYRYHEISKFSFFTKQLLPVQLEVTYLPMTILNVVVYSRKCSKICQKMKSTWSSIGTVPRMRPEETLFYENNQRSKILWHCLFSYKSMLYIRV